MSWSNIVTIYAKELRDILRDRRTLLSLIVVPTLVIPGLIMGVAFASYKVIRKAQSTPPAIMILGGEDSPKLRTELITHEKFNVAAASAEWKQSISDKRVGVAVEIPPGFDAALESGDPAEVTIYHYEGEVRSSFALAEVKRFLSDYREETVGSRLMARGLPASLVKPFDVHSSNVATPEKVGGNVIGGFIPYLFILLSFIGAMYPAMDLTAGEKERGTMETILCSPVSRLELVLGKFLTVLTASLGTVVCSLISMGASFAIAGSVIGGTASRAGMEGKLVNAFPSLDPLGTLAVLGMVVPMSVLFSALLFTISLFAKSFKEAQSYVSPLIIVVILPVVGGILPGVELDAKLALVPILNVSLVSKELVSGVWHWEYLALIFGSTSVYAAVALAFAVRMFNREDVLFRT